MRGKGAGLPASVSKVRISWCTWCKRLRVHTRFAQSSRARQKFRGMPFRQCRVFAPAAVAAGFPDAPWRHSGGDAAGTLRDDRRYGSRWRTPDEDVGARRAPLKVADAIFMESMEKGAKEKGSDEEFFSCDRKFSHTWSPVRSASGGFDERKRSNETRF